MTIYFPDDEMPTCDFRLDYKDYEGDRRSVFIKSPTTVASFNGLWTSVNFLCGKLATRQYHGVDHVDPGATLFWTEYRCEEHPERVYEGEGTAQVYDAAEGSWFDGYIKPLSQKPPSLGLWRRLRAVFA